MKDSHRLEFKAPLSTIVRTLPLREVAPGLRVALFNPLGDPGLIEAAGMALADRMPPEVEVLVMPEGKALALLHVVQREAGRDGVVVRKERKSYMREPVFETSAESITTRRKHVFYLDADDAEKLRGRKVAFLDDVVSQRGTLDATIDLLTQAGAELVAILAVCTEGPTPHEDVIALAHLPLFKD